MKPPALFAIALCLFTQTIFATLPSDYTRKMVVSVNPASLGYDSPDLENIPVAVRLSTAIEGFSYDDFEVAGGGDLLFTDETGAVLPHEIERWDPSGESIVWVRMPLFGPGRRIFAFYGGEAVAQNGPAVWSDYTGVWHMKEADGTVADATGNGHDATPGGESAGQSVATAGAVGQGRVNATSGTAYLAAANSGQLGLGGTFSFSGWFRAYSADPDGEATLVTAKERRWNDSGWGIRLLKGTDTTKLLYRGRGDGGDGTLVVEDIPDLAAGWVHLCVAYGPGDKGVMYVNGQYAKPYRKDHWDAGTHSSTEWLREPSDSGFPLTFGYNANNVWDDGWSRCFHGEFDELRIVDGTFTAARAAAEYAAQAPGALAYSVVENTSGLAPVALGNFTKKFTVSAPRYSSEETIENFPVLVRLSTAAISGFSYDDFFQPDYTDLAFFDSEGRALAFDVEVWNPAGESLVWVKVPLFTAGMQITGAYGGFVRNEIHQKATWSAYRGVWHLNETGDGEQAVADATANGLDGVAHAATRAVAAGQLGAARQIATARGSQGRVVVPFDGALNIAGDRPSFVVSTWINLSSGSNWGAFIFSRMNEHRDPGWGVSFCAWEMNDLDYYYRGDFANLPASAWTDSNGGYWQTFASEHGYIGARENAPNGTWHKYTIVYSYDGSIVHAYSYFDGVSMGEKWLYHLDGDGERSYAPFFQSSGRGLALGGTLEDCNYSLHGAMDEARFRSGSTTAAREALEYGQESDAAYYSYSSVSAVENTTVPQGVATFGEAADATMATDAAEGKVVLTIPFSVASVSAGEATIRLLVGVAEPKDGDPAGRLAEVATMTVSSPGNYSFVWDSAVLGTKVAYQVASAEVAVDATHGWTSTTAVKTLKLQDPASYRWVPNAKGLWSDRANWTGAPADNLPRLGYPSYGSKFNVYGESQVSEIRVDANYEDLGAFDRGSVLGWDNDTIVLKGVVEGAAIGYPENAGFRDRGENIRNVHVTLDGVALVCGSYQVYGGSSLTMLNGASLSTRWEVVVRGTDATLFVGDGCELEQRGVDGDRFELSGLDASLVISNGVVKANTLRLGGKNDSDEACAGMRPAGIFFLGTHPQLQIHQYAKVHADMGAPLPVVFSIPRDGYQKTPIVKTSASNHPFVEAKAGVVDTLAFSIDRQSPFYSQVKATLSQPVLDWNYEGTAYGIDADSFVRSQLRAGEWAISGSVLSAELALRPRFLIIVR